MPDGADGRCSANEAALVYLDFDLDRGFGLADDPNTFDGCRGNNTRMGGMMVGNFWF